MISLFRSIFAPPRHLILLLAALWLGLELAERRAERHNISKDALSNLVYYSLFGYILGGRLLFALANYSVFAQSPLSLLSLNLDLFDPFSALVNSSPELTMKIPFWKGYLHRHQACARRYKQQCSCHC